MPVTERALPPINDSGFRGMHASEDIAVPTGFLSLIQNCYLEGRKLKVRPGIVQAGAQLSAGNPVQVICHFEELDGTLHTVAICNADLFEYNWSTDSFSTTDLAGEGITVDPSAIMDWAVSRGRLIVTDGVNKPFMWDPSGPTFTTLSAAPIAGGVEIYYDRVFFFDLPGSDANVFEWSDETDPVNGYFASDQTWEFAQTDTGAVRNLVGLNEIMDVFKDDSIAMLKGAAEASFQTDAVREGVSETEGSPGKFLSQVVDGDVYYMSVNGPRVARSGMRRTPLDLDADGVNILGPIWDEFSVGQIRNGISFHDKKRRQLTWLMSLSGETTKYAGLTYSVESGSWAKTLFDSSFDFTCAASVENTDGEELVMLGDADGNVYIYDRDGDDNGTDFEYRVRSRQFGQSISVVQKRLAQVDLLIDVQDAPFSAKTRAYIDGEGDDTVSERRFGYDTVGKRRYRRAFNHVGYTVGWEFVGSAQDGRCELLASVTAMTTTGQHRSRG